MRHALLLLGLLFVVVALVGVLAWSRAGKDRYAGLEREGLGLVRVVHGAALESVETLRTAEHYLSERLAAVARRVEIDLVRTRTPAADILQTAADEARVGRIFLFDAERKPVAFARSPRPVASGPAALLTADEKAQLEWAEASRAVEKLAPGPGVVAAEGMHANVFGTRRRFGVAFGRPDGGVLLLRADAKEIAHFERRFGLGPLLDRIGALPDVCAVHLAGDEGAVLIAAGRRPATAPLDLPTLEPGAVAVTSLEEGALRVLLPVSLGEGQTATIDLRMSRSRADHTVARSRRAILLGALVAALIAATALLFIQRLERRHREQQARSAARLEEERRLAEMGALAGLVTHEVSNPVNSMRLALPLLERAESEDERLPLLASIREGTDRITESLEGFLRLASGPAPTASDITPALLEAVRARVARAAATCDVRLVLEVASEVRAARGDPLVVEEAIVNIVRNAVAASPAGGTVTMGWADADDDRVRITVADEGPGLPDDRDELVRLGGAKTGRGHGLGLPLARRFVHAQGGQLILGDAPGGGAAVEIVLRAAARPEPTDG